VKTLQELGETVAATRRELGLKQKDVAAQAGITPESLLRFERGQVSEFGSRKLLAVLAILGMEITFVKTGMSGSLDELRRERGGA
jgi:transcriptional regulator with XRE-family HTH domain